MNDEKFLGITAENIKKHRKKNKLTQSDMEYHGFKLRRYQDIESGKANLTLKGLFKLARALNTDVASLCEINDFCITRYEYMQLFNHAKMPLMQLRINEIGNPHKIDFLYCNDCMCEMVSHDLKKEFGQPLLKVFPNINDRKLFDAYFRIIETGVPEKITDYSYKDANVPLIVSDIFAAKTDHKVITVVTQHVTERYILQERNHSLNIQLEKKNVQHLDALSRIKKLEEENNKLKQVLMKSMSESLA